MFVLFNKSIITLTYIKIINTPYDVYEKNYYSILINAMNHCIDAVCRFCVRLQRKYIFNFFKNRKIALILFLYFLLFN